MAKSTVQCIWEQTQNSEEFWGELEKLGGKWSEETETFTFKGKRVQLIESSDSLIWGRPQYYVWVED